MTDGTRYAVIYADPPWSFKTYSDKGKGRSSEAWYDCMSLEDIKAFSVIDLAAQDCVLLMWVTDPMLQAGLEVITAWGFRYKTVGFYWVKTPTTWFGNGYWTRANPEMCLLATRGHPHRISAGVRKLVEAPRREHSRKPDEVYERIEQLLSGPYLELFARVRRPGWDAYGHEVDSGPAVRRWNTKMEVR